MEDTKKELNGACTAGKYIWYEKLRVKSRLDIGKTISERKYIVEENSHTEEKWLKEMKGASVTYGTVSRGCYQTSKEEIIPIIHRLLSIEKKERLFNSCNKASITLIPKPWNDVKTKKNTD